MKDAAGTPLNCAGVVVEHFLSPFYSSASPDISSTVSLSFSLSELPAAHPYALDSDQQHCSLCFIFLLSILLLPPFSSLLKAYLSLLFLLFPLWYNSFSFTPSVPLVFSPPLYHRVSLPLLLVSLVALFFSFYLRLFQPATL